MAGASPGCTGTGSLRGPASVPASARAGLPARFSAPCYGEEPAPAGAWGLPRVGAFPGGPVGFFPARRSRDGRLEVARGADSVLRRFGFGFVGVFFLSFLLSRFKIASGCLALRWAVGLGCETFKGMLNPARFPMSEHWPSGVGTLLGVKVKRGFQSLTCCLPLGRVSLELSQKPHDLGLKIKMLKRNSFSGFLFCSWMHL